MTAHDEVSSRYRRSATCYISLSLGVFLAAIAVAAQDSPQDARAKDAKTAQLLAAMQAAFGCETIGQIEAAAREFPHNSAYVREGLWFAAAAAVLNYTIDRPPSYHQERGTKLCVFATVLERLSRDEKVLWPAEEELFEFGPRSVDALEREVGYPHPDDPVRRLFACRPSWQEKSRSGYWRYVRLDFFPTGKSYIYESSDVPVAGFTPAWSGMAVGLNTKNEAARLTASGCSSTFPLKALEEVIVAGKFYLCLELSANPRIRPYADVLAGTALLRGSRASRVNPNLAEPSRAALKRAATALERDDTYELWAAEVQSKYISAAFFAGRRKEARDGYRAVIAHESDSGALVGAKFGIMICELGLNDPNAKSTLRQVVDGINPRSSRQEELRYDLRALRDALPELFGQPTRPAAWASKMDAWPPPAEDLRTRYGWNLGLVRVLIVSNLWEAATRHLIRELRFVRSIQDEDRERMERDYVLLLGATMSEAGFQELSWRVSETGVPERKLSPGGEELTNDFAPFFDPELVDERIGGSGVSRYGMIAPEEDRATCTEIYSNMLVIIPKIASGEGEARELAKRHYEFPMTLEKWANEQLASDPPNIVPLLKLAWLEWFMIPLVPLNSDPGIRMTDWHYSPETTSGLTLEQFDEAMRRGLAARPDVKPVWEAFRDVRNTFQENYGTTRNAEKGKSR